MAALLKCGAIFLHVPKTGGSWVSTVLEKNGLVFANVGEIHDDAKRIAEFERWFRIPNKYAKPNRPFFKFCFVRHPLTWYESWFKYQAARGWPNWGEDSSRWHPNAMLDGLGASDFATFLANVLERRPGYVSELYGWYVTREVHFVGRYEHLARDLFSVLEYLHGSIDEQRIRSVSPVNVSSTADVRVPSDLQQAVERAEYPAFRRFGYETQFHGPTPLRKAHSAASRFELPTEPLPLDAPFARGTGYCWTASLPQLAHWADDMADPYRSALALLEDGRALPSAHAVHEDISRQGRGRFSHWKTTLYFSTSDNSDPNRNGRRYQVRFQFGSAAQVDDVMILPLRNAQD